MAVLDRIDTLDADPREGGGGRAARLRGRARAAWSPTTCSRSASSPTSRAALRGGDDEVYFVQNLYLNQTNVCRVKCKFCAFARDAEAGGRLHAHGRRARRGRASRQRELTGFTEIHMVNGENPHVGFDFYVDIVAHAPRGAAGRAPEALHGERDPPHDEALRAHARGGAARAARRPGSARCPAAAPRSSPTACAGSSRPARSIPDIWFRRPRHGAPARASRRTARCSTATSRPTRSASTTCSGCATSRTRPAASSPSSRSRSIPRTPSSSGAASSHTTGADDLKMIAVSRLLLDNIAEHQGLLDHDGPAARAGRAPLRRERRPGHGRARADLPRRRRVDRDRAEDRGARPLRPRGRPHPGAARHALQRAAPMGRRDPRSGRISLREHGAGLLPARRRGRGGRRRPDRAERAAARGRGRPRADLVDRVRAQRRPAAHPAAALRLLGGRGRLDPARLADAARAGPHRSRSRPRARPRSC